MMEHKHYKPGRYVERKTFIRGKIGEGKSAKHGLFEVVDGKAVKIEDDKPKKKKKVK